MYKNQSPCEKLEYGATDFFLLFASILKLPSLEKKKIWISFLGSTKFTGSSSPSNKCKTLLTYYLFQGRRTQLFKRQADSL